MIKIGIPVKCHNGHRAFWLIEINGLEVKQLGVVDNRCDCEKGELNHGYAACGDAFVMDKDYEYIPWPDSYYSDSEEEGT